MKPLIYLLLLVNLSVFVWHYRGGDDKSPSDSGSDDGVSRLVLYREHESREAQKPVPDQIEESRESNQCYSLGPFTSLNNSREAQKTLQATGIETTSRTTRDESRKGYWVYLPPFESRKAARNMVAQLKEKNIKDYFLVATGEQKNAVSLGVFSQPELARRRQRQLEKKDIDAKIDTVSLPRRLYWLDWPTSSEAQLPDAVLEGLLEKYDDIGRVERDCQ